MGKAIVEISLAEEMEPVNQAIVGLTRRVMALETTQADDKLAYSVKQVAERTGVSDQTIYNLINGGIIPARWLGGKMIVLRGDLIAFLEGLPAAGWQADNQYSDNG